MLHVKNKFPFLENLHVTSATPTAEMAQQIRRDLPSSYIKKKVQILAEISNHNSNEYTDKSPKGTIDPEIIDLIDEINAFEGYVTTSSCAGRVAVFVEGKKASLPSTTKQSKRPESVEDETRGSGPGGKGYGNKWLYVSHSPVDESHGIEGRETSLHDFFGLQYQDPTGASRSKVSQYPQSHHVRLVKLSFSPLILHVLCADLHVAKPLLAAAINAGFRESGVQSLKALDDSEAGVMLAIRTAGLAFETVVGFVEEEEGREIYRSCVDEGFLGMCLAIVNERFDWNAERRERLRRGLRWMQEKDKGRSEWEDRETRRERKRMEGLERQRQMEAKAEAGREHDARQEAETSGDDPSEDEDLISNDLYQVRPAG